MICKCCELDKSTEEFFQHCDRPMYMCKKCYYLKDKESSAYRARRRRDFQKRRDKNKIYKSVAYKVLRGDIKKSPCVICGELKVEGHHNDYSKPLDVVWLCKEHHVWLHRIENKFKGVLK